MLRLGSPHPQASERNRGPQSNGRNSPLRAFVDALLAGYVQKAKSLEKATRQVEAVTSNFDS